MVLLFSDIWGMVLSEDGRLAVNVFDLLPLACHSLRTERFHPIGSHWGLRLLLLLGNKWLFLLDEIGHEVLSIISALGVFDQCLQVLPVFLLQLRHVCAHFLVVLLQFGHSPRVVVVLLLQMFSRFQQLMCLLFILQILQFELLVLSG